MVSVRTGYFETLAVLVPRLRISWGGGDNIPGRGDQEISSPRLGTAVLLLSLPPRGAQGGACPSSRRRAELNPSALTEIICLTGRCDFQSLFTYHPLVYLHNDPLILVTVAPIIMPVFQTKSGKRVALA